jgi:hypothetical protein
MKEYFSITSVCRADLYDFLPKVKADALGDDEMQRIADRLANVYVENVFWESLKCAVEDY